MYTIEALSISQVSLLLDVHIDTMCSRQSNIVAAHREEILVCYEDKLYFISWSKIKYINQLRLHYKVKFLLLSYINKSVEQILFIYNLNITL